MCGTNLDGKNYPKPLEFDPWRWQIEGQVRHLTYLLCDCNKINTIRMVTDVVLCRRCRRKEGGSCHLEEGRDSVQDITWPDLKSRSFFTTSLLNLGPFLPTSSIVFLSKKHFGCENCLQWNWQVGGHWRISRSPLSISVHCQGISNSRLPSLYGVKSRTHLFFFLSLYPSIYRYGFVKTLLCANTTNLLALLSSLLL